MSIAFPGYVSDVHAADALDPAWGNAIRDRANQVFTTAALRDAAITVPQVGQQAILTAAASGSDTGIYVYVGSTMGWRRPWNMPWGPVAAVAQATANQGPITTIVDLTSLAITFTAIANRRYRITARLNFLSSTSTDGFVTTLADGSSTQLTTGVTWGGSASVSTGVGLTHDTTTPSVAGSYTFKLRGTRTGAGTLNMVASATQPAQLTVEDIGPNGAPS